MIFTYSLALVLVTWTLAQGRSLRPATMMSYEELKHQLHGEQTTVDGVVVDDGGGGDRLANLKYVMAIRNSSIWEEVTVRSLSASTVDPNTVLLMVSKLDSLSDKDLAAVKSACEVGLKCVAVDHLLMLSSTEERLSQTQHDERTMSVLRAITKITRVLTKYMDEYHEESAYQYVEVTESDDPSIVNRLVSVILKDNAELCGLIDKGANDTHAKAAVARNAAGDTGVRHPETKTTGTQTSDDDPKAPAFVNNGLVNYGTINNYNINNGNINSATINSQSPVNVIEPDGSGRDTPVKNVQPNQTPKPISSYPINQSDAKDGDRSADVNASNSQPGSVDVDTPTTQFNTTGNDGKSTDVSVPIGQFAFTEDGDKTMDVSVPIGQPDAKEDGDKSANVNAPTNQPSVTIEGGISTDIGAPAAEISVTVDRNGGKGTRPTSENNEAPTDVSPRTEKNDSDSNSALVDASTQTMNYRSGNNNSVNSGNNNVTLDNGSGDTGKYNDATEKDNNNSSDGSKNGSNLSGMGIVSVGSTNDNTVRDGVVEDGIINNDKMKLYEVNPGVRNKGIVNRSKAGNGIINVGTINDGPTNYGTLDRATNYGTVADLKVSDVQQFAMDIDKMYSAVLAGLAA